MNPVQFGSSAPFFIQKRNNIELFVMIEKNDTKQLDAVST